MAIIFWSSVRSVSGVEGLRTPLDTGYAATTRSMREDAERMARDVGIGLDDALEEKACG